MGEAQMCHLISLTVSRCVSRHTLSFQLTSDFSTSLKYCILEQYTDSFRQYCELPRVQGCVPWPPVGCRIHVQCLVWRHWIWVFWREQTCSSFSLCPRWVKSHYTCKDRQIPLKTTAHNSSITTFATGNRWRTEQTNKTHTNKISVSHLCSKY